MDELERELKALREATDRVAASPGLKSELLLAVSRSGAATTATGLSVKIVVALVTAGAAGGVAVWSLMREPEATPPAPSPPVVEVNVTVAPSVATTRPRVAETPLDAQVPPPALVPVGAAGPAHVIALQAVTVDRCSGLQQEPAESRPLNAHLKERLKLPPDVPPGELAYGFFDPMVRGQKFEGVLSNVKRIEEDLFWMRLQTAGDTVWFVLPGFEPVGIKTVAGAKAPQYLGIVRFGRLESYADFAVHVEAPFGDVSVSLKPEPCGDAVAAFRPTEGPDLQTKQGRYVVFDHLSLTPWRVTARSPGATTAELEITPARTGRNDVTLTLERARKVTLEAIAAPPGELCKTAPVVKRIIPGEHFSVAGPEWLWLKQKSQRVSFDHYAPLTGGYVGHGMLQSLCRNPTPAEPFSDREIRTGDVYMFMNDAEIVLMRLTVQ